MFALFWAWRRRRVECKLWNCSQRCEIFFSEPNTEKHSVLWGVQSSVTLTWALTTLGSFWVFSRYFYSPPLFYFFLIVFFSLSASFPALSVLCQMGSCCHRNHKCLWLPLSLFLFSSSAFLHVFLFFSLPCDKYLFPCHLRKEVWGMMRMTWVAFKELTKLKLVAASLVWRQHAHAHTYAQETHTHTYMGWMEVDWL